MASFAVAAPPVMSAVASAVRCTRRRPRPARTSSSASTDRPRSADCGGSCTHAWVAARWGRRSSTSPATIRKATIAGVYYQESSIYGAALGDIKQLGFHYVADDEDLGPGNLSLNIPIDEDGDGVSPTQYAVHRRFYCPGTDGVVEHPEDDECGIWYVPASVQYENWDAFVEALEEFPDALVATDELRVHHRRAHAGRRPGHVSRQRGEDRQARPVT